MQRRALITAGCLAIVGCTPGLNYNEYVAVHQSAKAVLPCAVQMESLFGNADHFITHYGFSGEKRNTWNTVVYFGGRYTLTMQIEVAVDYRHRQIRRVGTPAFFLWEVSRVDVLSDGRTQATYSRDIRFDERQWKRIYESGGDFSTVNIQLLSSRVPNFDLFVAAERRPRIPISLLTNSARPTAEHNGD